MRTLQKILVGLTPAKFIAVQQLSQDNCEPVNGTVPLTPIQRMELVKELEIDGKADSIRRIFITRSAGRYISTMKDKAKQCLLLMDFEPE